jgi:multidrug resistance efflux pump
VELLLLGIYSFIVWLIFFKYKLLPWNTVSQVIVITLPIIGIAALILLLNIVAPSSADVRVINYVVAVNARVQGLVTDVPVEPNRPVKKGDVLFKLDPTPFELEVNALEAQLEQLEVQLITAGATTKGLTEQLRNARGAKNSIAEQLKLAQVREEQTRQLAETGAGSRYDYEQAQMTVANLKAQLEAATATESQARQKLGAKTDSGDQDEIASAKAQIARAEAQLKDAKWHLDQTVYRAHAGDDVRRGRSVDHDDLQAERSAEDQARTGSRDRDEDVPGPDHQVQSRLDHVGDCAGPAADRRCEHSVGRRAGAAEQPGGAPAQRS